MDVTNSVFVGRDAELSILNNALQAAIQGGIQVCLVAGDPGDGKTTLVENFLVQSKETKRTLLYAIGTCDIDTGQRNYYEPFRDIFSQLTGVRAKNLESLVTAEQEVDARSLFQITIEVLREFAPELIGTLVPGASLVSKVTLSAADKLLQRRIQVISDKDAIVKHEEIRKQSVVFFEKRATKAQPLILVIDDMQWVDRLSLDLLFHVLKHLHSAGLLVIFTFRPGELGQDSEIGKYDTPQALIKWVKQECNSVEIDLRKTRSSRGRDFVAQFLDANGCVVGDQFSNEFFNRTAAWPILAVELLRFLRDRGVLEQNQLGIWKEALAVSEWKDIPSRLTKPEALIDARLGQLDEELREILRVASVEGFEFTAQVFSSMKKIDERTLLRMLSDELGRKHGLVMELNEERVGDTVLSHFRFTNIWYQDFIYQNMGMGERRVLHERIAQALDSLYGQHASRIAINLSRHYELGRNLQKAAHYLIETGRQQAANHEYDVASQTLEHGLSLAREADYVEGIVDALRFLAVNIHLARRKPEDFLPAEKLLEECTTLSTKHGLQKALSFSLRGQGRIHRHYGRNANAMYCYMEGLNAAKQIDDKREAAKFFTNLGVLASDEDRMEEALFYAKNRLAIAKDIEDEQGQAVAYMNLGDYLRKIAESEEKNRAKNLQDAFEMLQQARKINDQLADTSRAIGIQVIEARVYAQQGDIAKATNLIYESIVDAHSQGFDGRTMECLEGFACMTNVSSSSGSLLFEVIGFVKKEGGAKQKKAVTLAGQKILQGLSEDKKSGPLDFESHGAGSDLNAIAEKVIEFLSQFRLNDGR